MAEPTPPTARRGLGRLVRSVRFRVTAVATLVVLVVLAASALALVASLRQRLTTDLTDRVEAQAELLAEQAHDGTLPAELGDLADDADALVAVDGAVVAQTDDADEDLAGLLPGAGGGDAVGTRDVDGEPHRVVTVTGRGGSGGSDDDEGEDDGGSGGRATTVVVAAPLDGVEEPIEVLRGVLVAAIPAVVAVLAVLIWVVVGRMLKPVEAIRAEAASISGTDLHRRLPVPDSGDEVARLAATVNELLDRVEAASRRQQRFVADASHDLRSPLTRIRAELEVDLARPAAADLLATHASVLEETVGLQRLVDDLLLLARSDEASAAPPATAVDLDDLVLAEVRRLRARGGDLVVDASGVTAGQVRGDADQLARVVANLVDNARRYARSTVVVTLAEQGDRVLLSVADDGPGIPPADHERVFERFARVDEARDAARGGTGLGLAIARDVVTRHGGVIAVDPTHTPGARLVVALPKA